MLRKAKIVRNYVPCALSCPLANPIPEWLTLYRNGQLEKAYRLLLKTNPFPAILGRICYHHCEKVCNRQQLDNQAVLIHQLESNLGDLAFLNNWLPVGETNQRSQKILIIGSGPAGLSAAFYLKLFGYQVTVVEKEKFAGGTMLFGIPAFRLPKETIDQEIKRLKRLGVKILNDYVIKDFALERQKYDAVFLAMGALLGKKITNINVNQPNVWDAITFLKRSFYGTLPALGKDLVVYGGGNTAMDVARVGVRLGCNVKVIYHRFREKMKALLEEIEQAEREGIIITCLRSIEGYEQKTLTLRVNQCDADGTIHPTSATETLNADHLVLALNQDIDIDFLNQIPHLKVEHQLVQVDNNLQTNLPGVFAGGDLIQKERNVTLAVKNGRQAAYSIKQFLETDQPQTFTKQTLNATIQNEKNNTEIPLLTEARRCYRCGNCIGCQRCVKVCPKEALVLQEHKVVAVSETRCIGCGKCVKVCPVKFLQLTEQ